MISNEQHLVTKSIVNTRHAILDTMTIILIMNETGLLLHSFLNFRCVSWIHI